MFLPAGYFQTNCALLHQKAFPPPTTHSPNPSQQNLRVPGLQRAHRSEVSLGPLLCTPLLLAQSLQPTRLGVGPRFWITTTEPPLLLGGKFSFLLLLTSWAYAGRPTPTPTPSRPHWTLLVVSYSVSKSGLTIYDSMDCSTPSFPDHHYLLEFPKSHVRWVGDTIQPSHPLSPPLLLLPLIFPSIRVFSNESTLRIRWPKYWRLNWRPQSISNPEEDGMWLWKHGANGSSFPQCSSLGKYQGIPLRLANFCCCPRDLGKMGWTWGRWSGAGSGQRGPLARARLHFLPKEEGAL